MKKLFHKDNIEEHNFWMSYTDLMSGFLVVFIIISIIAYSHYSKIANTMSGKTPDEIEKMFLVLDSLKSADLKNLIYEYKDVFVADKYINVKFDSKIGSIVISCRDSHRYLFAPGHADFELELRNYLDKIRKPLVKRTIDLWNKRNYSNVELRIEGHTDPNGISSTATRGSDQSFLENMKLSSDRANQVYNYLLNNEELSDEEKNFVKKNMISVGYSFATRVNQNDIDNINLDPSSRRIEFRIISK